MKMQPRIFTDSYSYANQEQEFVMCHKSRPFAVLVSPNLPTPSSSYIDHHLAKELGLKITDISCKKISFAGKKLRLLGKVSFTAQCVKDGHVFGTIHFKGSVIEDLRLHFDTHAIAGGKMSSVLHEKDTSSSPSRSSTSPSRASSSPRSTPSNSPSRSKSPPGFQTRLIRYWSFSSSSRRMSRGSDTLLKTTQLSCTCLFTSVLSSIIYPNISHKISYKFNLKPSVLISLTARLLCSSKSTSISLWSQLPNKMQIVCL